MADSLELYYLCLYHLMRAPHIFVSGLLFRWRVSMQPHRCCICQMFRCPFVGHLSTVKGTLSVLESEWLRLADIWRWVRPSDPSAQRWVSCSRLPRTVWFSNISKFGGARTSSVSLLQQETILKIKVLSCRMSA